MITRRFGTRTELAKPDDSPVSNGRRPSLKQQAEIMSNMNSAGNLLPDSIREVFDNENMLQRSVLHPKLARALIRAEAYCRYYDDEPGLQLVESIYEIVVSFGGKGRKDMRDAIAAAMGIAIRAQSSVMDTLTGVRKD